MLTRSPDLLAGYAPVSSLHTNREYKTAHVAIDTQALGLDRVTPASGRPVSATEAYHRTRAGLRSSGIVVADSRATDLPSGRLGFNLAVPEDGLGHLDQAERDRAIRAHVATAVVESMDLGDKLVPVSAWQKRGGPGGTLFVPDASIFPPSQFGAVLTTEVLPAYRNVIGGGDVLDMGTASNIIGVGAAREGARKVTATDINDVAVDIAAPVSWAVNGFEPQRLRTVVSDGFTALSPGDRFAAILTNPPVQPETGGPKSDWRGYNESGADGRGLLDQALIKSAEHLDDGGVGIITSTSRHGPEKTAAMLAELEEQGKISGHGIIYQDRVQLDQDQYGAYVPFWLRRGAETGVPRIYPAGHDESGNQRYAHDLLVYAVHK